MRVKAQFSSPDNTVCQRMKAALVVFAVVLNGCAHSQRVYVTEKVETVRVTRLTEERDAGYQLRHFEPPGSPVFYADIHFRVEAPATFRGREIVLPIIKDTEGPLFRGAKFTVRIPAYFLDGKRSSEVKMPDGTTQRSTTDGLSFEGILVEPGEPTATALRP